MRDEEQLWRGTVRPDAEPFSIRLRPGAAPSGELGREQRPGVALIARHGPLRDTKMRGDEETLSYPQIAQV
jgi:hypothetical protein